MVQLDKTLETYLLEGMQFTNLQSISLTTGESDSATSSDFPGTPFFFSGFATFSGEPPLRSAVNTEEKFLLQALPNVQAAIDKNSALNGVSVVDVRFGGIDEASSLSSDDDARRGKSNIGVILGITVTISAVAIAVTLLIIRRHRSVQIRAPSKDSSSPTTKYSVETFVGVEIVCGSMVSVSLGDGDMSTNMMTASPTNPTIPEDISICHTDDFYDVDSYLDMDETSRVLEVAI